MSLRKHESPPISRNEGQEERPEKQIAEVLAAIDRIELLDEFKDELEQIQLLEKRKKLVKIKVGNLLQKINQYMNAISKQEKLRIEKDYYDREAYREKMEEADDFRTDNHDALISELHSTIRFIAMNFANTSEAAIEKWEDEQEEKGLSTLKIKRIDLPQKILCPDKINLADRDHIAAWAGDIYLATGKLEKEPRSKK